MFFFFNFSINLDYNPFIRKAFELVCTNKLELEGYCDMNPFFDNPTIRKDILAWELRKINSKLAILYNHRRYPNDMDECEKLLLPIFEKMSLNMKNEDNIELNHIEAVAIVYLIYKSLGKPEERVEYTQKMVRQTDVNVRLQSGFIYMDDYIDLTFVGNVTEFIKLVDSCKLENEDKKIFYRGHSDANYLLNPSIYRNEEWLVNERKMYFELIANCANDFKNMKNHLDYLVEMQHYGLPIRLLDITQNPLVSLYFACESSEKIYGEVIILAVNKEQIKYSQSDTVTVLASLPLFSFEDQKNFLELSLGGSKNQEEFNNGIKRLLHEIKTEKPAFMNIVEKMILERILL